MTTTYTAAGVLPKMLAKMNNGQIFSGAARHSPLLDSGMIPKKQSRGRDPVVNLSTGGNSSTGIIIDNQTITHDGPTKTQLRVTPTTLYSGLQLGRKAVHQSRSKSEVVDHLVDEFENSFEQMGAFLDSLMLDQQIATVASVETAGAVTSFDIDEVFSLENGMTIQILDVSNSDTSIFTSVVESVAWASDPAGPHTVTVTSATLDANTAVGDKVVLSGHDRGNNDDTFVSLADLCNSAESVYGLAATGNGYNWLGVTTSSAGALTVSKLNTLEAKRRKKSKKALKFVVSDSLVEQEYIKLRESAIHYPPGGSIDIQKYSNTTYKSKPWIVDDNQRQSTLFLVGDNAVSLCEARTFSIDGMDGKRPPNDLTAFRKDGTYAYEFETSGDYQLYCTSRQSVGTMTGITLT